MILRHLRYLASVVEHGTVVGAARVLRVAQPSLSRQIRALEHEVGVPLIERTRRGIRATPAGSLLLAGSVAVTERLDDALGRVWLAHEGRLGTIRLGLSRAALQSSRVGHAIAALRARLPHVGLEVREVISFTQVDALLTDDLDVTIGLHGVAQDRAIQRETLFDEIADSATVADSHPLAKAKRIHPSQLRSEKLMMIDPIITRGFSELHRALAALHSGPVEMHETVASIYSLVAAGRGWTPALAALRESPPPGTAVVPLEGLRVPMSMAVSWRTRDRSRLIANVVAVLREASTDDASTSPLEVDAPRNAGRPDAQRPRGLEARHLRALTVTIAEGSVSRAATRLGITQSGLSRRLRALENEIGVPLLARTASGVMANAAGVSLQADAITILSIIDGAVSRAQATRRGSTRPCRIGSVPSELSGVLMLDVIRHLGDTSPDIAVEIAELLSPMQASALRDGAIDVGIATVYPGAFDDPGIASVQINDDSIECALLSTSHPLASRAWLKPADLADEPFLFIPRTTWPRFYDSVLLAFERIGLQPRIEGSFNGPRAVWRLAADAMGWTLGSRQQRTSPPPGLVAIPIEGFRIPSGLQVLWRRDEADPRINAVLDAFRRTPAGA